MEVELEVEVEVEGTMTRVSGGGGEVFDPHNSPQPLQVAPSGNHSYCHFSIWCQIDDDAPTLYKCTNFSDFKWSTKCLCLGCLVRRLYNLSYKFE